MPFKVPQFIATRPDDNGNPIGGGYQCTVCGLTQLHHQEPHIRSTGIVCYPAKPGETILTHAGPKGSIVRSAPPPLSASPKPAVK